MSFESVSLTLITTYQVRSEPILGEIVTIGSGPTCHSGAVQLQDETAAVLTGSKDRNDTVGIVDLERVN